MTPREAINLAVFLQETLVPFNRYRASKRVFEREVSVPLTVLLLEPL